MSFTQKAIRVIKSVSRPDGFLCRPNLGKSAGGSLAEHLHMHVVPRWSGTPTSSRWSARPRWSQLLRDTRELLAEGVESRERLLPDDPGGVHETQRAGGQAALRVGLTPDTVTIIGTAGSVLAR